MNDAPVVLAVVLLASDDPITWLTPLLVVYELARRRGHRVRAGPGGAWALRRAALPSTGLYPLAALAVCVLAYSARHARARVAGCSRPTSPRWCSATPTCRTAATSLSFAEGTGWLAQIGLFVLLGLYASPPRLVDAVVPALDRRGRAGAWPRGRCR